MDLKQFCRLTDKIVNNYFDQVAAAVSKGNVQTTVPDPMPSFPQTIVVTKTPHHYGLELIGGRTTHKRLKVVTRELKDTDEFLSQFKYSSDFDPMTSIGGDNCGFSNLAMVTTAARSELERRFPGILQLFPTQLEVDGDSFGPTIRVAPTANYFRLDNMLLANSLDKLVRIRHIRFALLVLLDTPEEEYRTAVQQIFATDQNSQPVGFEMLTRGNAEVAHRAGQFANLFLMNKLHETSIGSFIDQHREILLTALDALDFISEPSLTWQVPPPDPEATAVNPDLFVQRADGFWDIYDLKLALLDKRDITTGGSRRRRFVYTIEDGIAQLAHYKDFLSHPENVLHAQEKYGLQFQEPRYSLIVGNYENVDPEKVKQAQLRLGNFEILDYDSLLQLYVVKSGGVPDETNQPSVDL